MDRVADALRSFATLDRAARGDEARITDALRDAVARLAAALDLTALLVVSVDNRYGGRVRLLAVRSSDDAAPGANGSSLRRFEDEAIPEAAYGIQVVAEAAGADVGRTALLLDPMQPEPATEPRPGAPLLVALHRAGPTTAAPVAGDLERAATLLWLALDRLDSPLVAADAGPDRETAARIADDNVAFTVYRPRALPAGTWTTVLAFAHLTEAPAGDSDPVAAVRDQAARLLGSDAAGYRESSSDATAAVPRGGALTFQLHLPGCDVNQPEQSFRWLEDVHRCEFRVQAPLALVGTPVRGALTVYLGPLVIGLVSLQVPVVAPDAVPAAPPEPVEPVAGSVYRRIFPSYSHRDAGVVEAAVSWAEAIGDRYLQDVRALRAGEEWSERLRELIAEADVFQLFWSEHARSSVEVAREYRYALTLGRRGFIRPTYWEQPCPPHPAELARLHFQALPSARLRSGAGDALDAPPPITGTDAPALVVASHVGAAAAAPPGEGAPPPAPAAPAAPPAPPPAPRGRRRRPRTALAGAGAMAVLVLTAGVVAVEAIGGRSGDGTSAIGLPPATGGANGGPPISTAALVPTGVDTDPGVPPPPVALALPRLAATCRTVDDDGTTATFACPGEISAVARRYDAPAAAQAAFAEQPHDVITARPFSTSSASGTFGLSRVGASTLALDWVYDDPPELRTVVVTATGSSQQALIDLGNSVTS